MKKVLFFILIALHILACFPFSQIHESNYKKIDANEIEIRIFDMTNNLRKDLNLLELKKNKELDKLALYHSKNMVNFNFLVT